MAIIKTIDNSKGWQHMELLEPSYIAEGMRIGIAILKNSLEVAQNIKYGIMYDPSIPPLVSMQENGNIRPHKNLCTNVHSNMIHESPKVEAIQISIN